MSTRALLLAIMLSVLATFILVLAGGILAGGFGGSDFIWMFCVSILPITISCFVLGALSPRLKGSRSAMWVAAVLTGFVAVTFAGSVTAPLVQSLQFGIDRVNISGYVAWGPIYGLCLLPLSAPLSYLAIKLLSNGTADPSLQPTLRRRVR